MNLTLKNNTNISPLLNRNRKIKITNKQMILLSIFMCFFISALFLNVYAFFGGEYEYNGTNYHYKNAASHLAMKMVTDVYGQSFLSGINDLISISSFPAYSGLMSVVDTVYSYVAPVGSILLVLYFCLELIEKTQMDNFNVEHFIKMFIKIIVGVMLIDNMKTLLNGAIGFSDSIASMVAMGPGDAPANDTAIAYLQELEKASFITAIPYIIELLIPSLIMLLCKLIIYLTLYSRIIEFFARCVFAPIGMANIYGGGINSSGFRYFKKIVAVGLQGAIIVAIMACMNAIMGTINDQMGNSSYEAFFGPINQIIVGFSTAMLIIKSQSWANDIVGA